MTLKDCVILKPGKEKAIHHRHHWIFSGAVQTLPKSFEPGTLLPVYSSTGEHLGSGYFNRRSSLIGRMLTFDQQDPLHAIDHALQRALAFRSAWFDSTCTNAYRLINGEGDGIPGLIIDCYDKTVVLQSGTAGIDRLKPHLVAWLNRHLSPKTLYEKSILPSRREEGLEPIQGYLSGEAQPTIHFIENGLRFTASLPQAQKTGFFLDQREMRQWVRTLAKGKRVLNAFSYTGAFSIYALAGGATEVDSIDISPQALEMGNTHLTLNQLEHASARFICADVFSFLRQHPLPYDLVILDPPAFAKRREDVIAACRGYKDINRLAMQQMPAGSLLLTCSCSYHVDEALFQKVLFQAAYEAKRCVRIVGRHRLAPDHPINLYHPESQYLKSFLLAID